MQVSSEQVDSDSFYFLFYVIEVLHSLIEKLIFRKFLNI